MQLPLGFGRVDWSEWARGLVAAFVSGGATSVVSGVVVSVNDPQHYDSAGVLKLMFSVFVTCGCFNMFSFLVQKPIPSVIISAKEGNAP